jgi:hypothetical protein
MATITMRENPRQQSIDTKAARHLAITNNTIAQMVGITPRWLLHFLVNSSLLAALMAGFKFGSSSKVVQGRGWGTGGEFLIQNPKSKMG